MGMSGGSMDYLYCKVDDASFTENTPMRRALRAHLTKLAKALRAVEWNDSGDGADDEDKLIAACLPADAPLRAAIESAETAKRELAEEISRARATGCK
jgi:hypothetical protein